MENGITQLVIVLTIIHIAVASKPRVIKRGGYIDSEREAEARGIFAGGFVLRLEARAIFLGSFVWSKLFLWLNFKTEAPKRDATIREAKPQRSQTSEKPNLREANIIEHQT